MYLVIARIDTYILCMKESRNISYRGRRMIKCMGSKALQYKRRHEEHEDVMFAISNKCSPILAM